MEFPVVDVHGRIIIENWKVTNSSCINLTVHFNVTFTSEALHELLLDGLRWLARQEEPCQAPLLDHKHPVINIIIRNEVIETSPHPDL